MNFKKYMRDVSFILIFFTIIFSISYFLLNITYEREIFTKNFTRFGIDTKNLKPEKILEIDIDKDLDNLNMEKFHIYKYEVDAYEFKNIKKQLENNSDLISYDKNKLKNKNDFNTFSKLLASKDQNEWNEIFDNSPKFYALYLSSESNYYYNLTILLNHNNIIYFVN